MYVTPRLDVTQLFGLREGEFLTVLHLISLLVDHEHSLGNDLSRVEYSSKSGPQQVSFFPTKGRVCIDVGVEISREDVLDLAGLDDVRWSTVGQLDPIREKVIRDPKDCLIYAFTSLLHRCILIFFLSLVQTAHGNPIVFLSSKNFPSKSNLIGSAHYRQTFDRL